MEKNTYETYEFLPADDPEAAPEQFFIVQDDGTFLINRQVQYVTQVQDAKDVLDGVQNCTVYDVTQQQFFVDVDNSAELVSVPDNFILPENGGNLYGSSYLLQTVANSNTEQIEENAVDNQLNQTETQTDADGTEISKKNSSCTEITLNDDQYKMLEEKGWLLLETNEKVFILDTLGLHDITTNHELIQQLKSEGKCNSDLRTGSRSLKIEEPSTVKFDGIVTQSSSDEQETVNFVIEDKTDQNIDDISDIPTAIIKEQDKYLIEFTKQEEEDVKILSIESERESFKETIPEVDSKRNISKTIRIKTKFPYKDVPDKIILSKTINGKNLVARLKRPITNIITPNSNQIKLEQIPVQLPKLAKATRNCKSILKDQQPKHTGLFAWQFDNMIKQVVQGGERVACSAEQVAAAGEIIEQLLQVPDFLPAVTDTNIVVTKAVMSKTEDNTNDINPNLVAGRVTSMNGRLRFVHIPDLLQKLLSGTEMSKRVLNADNTATCPANAGDCNVLHVHVVMSETMGAGSVDARSITLNKRQLPCTLPSEPKKRKTIAFACSSCASVFNSEEELTVHQVTHCVDFEDELTIDTDKMVDDDDVSQNIKLNPYCVVKSSKGTLYTCLYCSMKFNKLSNCLRHVKTHIKPVRTSKELSEEKSDVDKTYEKKSDAKVYKCKMCSSTYYHSSTLSKHIVSTHIKVNKK